MGKVKLSEERLLQPVLTLFPATSFWHLEQVALGRKKIDLVCVDRGSPHRSTSIELKIRDWRKALWQAAVNLQLTHSSYIAIWHEYAHRAHRESSLLVAYGVGLISVHPGTAEILVVSVDPVRRLSREKKGDWYRQLIAS